MPVRFIIALVRMVVAFGIFYSLCIKQEGFEECKGNKVLKIILVFIN